jgi:hypothetical protein
VTGGSSARSLEWMRRSIGSARRENVVRAGRLPLAVLAAALVGGVIILLGGTATQARQTRATATSPPEFISLVPACACGRTTVLAAFSLRTGRRLRTITPVTTTSGESVSLTGGPSGEVVETATKPAICTSGIAGCGPKPNTCQGRVSELLGSTFRPVFTAPDSVELSDAVASPDRRRLAIVADPCTTGTARLLVRDLATGTQHSIANLPRCSTLSPAAWSTNGRQLLFPLAAAPTSPRLAAGICPSVPYSRLAVASATRPSSPAAWTTIAADRGCSFEAATFDATGIAAVEGCRRAGVSGSAIDPGLGQAVLVELNQHDRVTQRIKLQPGWEQGVISTERSGDVLISQDQPANEPYPERDWVWELHDHHLRLIASYKAIDAAEILAIPH